jgi:hypothetical protein
MPAARVTVRMTPALFRLQHGTLDSDAELAEPARRHRTFQAAERLGPDLATGVCTGSPTGLPGTYTPRTPTTDAASDRSLPTKPDT